MAALNVRTILLGKSRLAANLFRLLRKEVVRSDTRLRCTARTVQHVYRQIQTLMLFLLLVAFMYKGPVKSTPVEVNGKSILTRKSGSGGGTGAE